jgi:hypothetical protein
MKIMINTKPEILNFKQARNYKFETQSFAFKISSFGFKICLEFRV